jgi:hypothetical protein
MDITRNQYFLFGLVILFLGIEILCVDAFTLTPEFTTFLAKQSKQPATGLLANAGAIPPKTIAPPDWLGWSLLSFGNVLILHSLAMKKPGS